LIIALKGHKSCVKKTSCGIRLLKKAEIYAT